MNQTVHTLKLDRNKIRDEGARYISDALKVRLHMLHFEMMIFVQFICSVNAFAVRFWISNAFSSNLLILITDQMVHDNQPFACSASHQLHMQSEGQVLY